MGNCLPEIAQEIAQYTMAPGAPSLISPGTPIFYGFKQLCDSTGTYGFTVYGSSPTGKFGLIITKPDGTVILNQGPS
jgi:hypothetical protein